MPLKFTANRLEAIPTPAWLRRWYYKISFELWGNPNNGHWKLTHEHIWQFTHLNINERCLWCGKYVPVIHEMYDTTPEVVITPSFFERD